MKTHILIIISLICLFLMAVGYYKLSNGIKSESWPSVKGSVVKSELRQSESYSSKKHGSHKTKYSSVIDYQYEVNGKMYCNNTISYKIIIFPNSRALEIQRKYPVDKEVQVFYSPDNPKQSVLVPGIDKWNYYIVFVPLFVLLMFFLSMLKDRLLNSCS